MFEKRPRVGIKQPNLPPGYATASHNQKVPKFSQHIIFVERKSTK